MEYQGRRNRRGRERRSRPYVAPQSIVIPHFQKSWSLLDGFSSFFILISLMAIIYLMLDYHCTVCNTKCDLTNITNNIDDIAVNISLIKESYYDLETKIIRFSHELPKIEGQIELLESLAYTIGGGDYQSSTEHDPRIKVDVALPEFAYEPKLLNVTKKHKKPLRNKED